MTLQIQFYQSTSPTQTSPWSWTDNGLDASKHGWCSLKVMCSEQQFWGPEWAVMREGQGGSVNKCFISSWEGIYVGEYWWPVQQSGIIKKSHQLCLWQFIQIGVIKVKVPSKWWVESSSWPGVLDCAKRRKYGSHQESSLCLLCGCDVTRCLLLLPPCLPYHDDDGLCAVEL